jgi:hypothetical protein
VDESPPARYFVPTEQAVEELVDLVIEHLVPVAGWYREQHARHLEVGGPGLTVIEQVRWRPSSAGRLSRTTAMTPSAVTKVVRRVRSSMQHLVSSFGPHDEERLRIAANVLVHAVDTLGREATGMEALHARRAMIVRRRRAREAAGMR